jgi:hypothetical protein
MKFGTTFVATIALAALCSGLYLVAGTRAATAPPEQCDVPESFVESDTDLPAVTKETKDRHHLDISVVGTASSSISGPDGLRSAYPARLDDVLKQHLTGIDIKVTAHVQPRATTAAMVPSLEKILSDDKPSLVIWQTGTADAISGVEPDDFRASLDSGVAAIQAAGADVILMNMQFSPRTESMLDVSAYADVMHVVAQQRGAMLFDRLGLMHYWNDAGTFDLYTATKKYDIARRVHDCIGWALASQIINAAHLDAVRMQTTR